MGRHKKIKSQDPFVRHSTMTAGSVVLVRGDIIKIQGEWGRKFKFHDIVTNSATGVQWVDCFELQKGTGGLQVACAWRSFYPDKVKTIPKKRGKRGNSTVKTS